MRSGRAPRKFTIRPRYARFALDTSRAVNFRLRTRLRAGWRPPRKRRRSGEDADIAGIDQIRHRPAVDVVFGHALVGKGLPLHRLARGIGAEDREAANLL